MGRMKNRECKLSERVDNAEFCYTNAAAVYMRCNHTPSDPYRWAVVVVVKVVGGGWWVDVDIDGRVTAILRPQSSESPSSPARLTNMNVFLFFSSLGQFFFFFWGGEGAGLNFFFFGFSISRFLDFRSLSFCVGLEDAGFGKKRWCGDFCGDNWLRQGFHFRIGSSHYRFIDFHSFFSLSRVIRVRAPHVGWMLSLCCLDGLAHAARSSTRSLAPCPQRQQQHHHRTGRELYIRYTSCVSRQAPSAVCYDATSCRRLLRVSGSAWRGDGWMDGWMDGRMDGWTMDGWMMDGWMAISMDVLGCAEMSVREIDRVAWRMPKTMDDCECSRRRVSAQTARYVSMRVLP